jgi:methylenetetrahydrofolate--tRNA-(uracil-5-)-methyltransferase
MQSEDKPITIIGGGLAGCEAAWQLLKRGRAVRLVEMKPGRYSPAHTSPLFAELVCSNSLRSNEIVNAVGLLKEEMRLLDSLIIAAADRTAVPAGRALAVDRELFSRCIEEQLNSCGALETVREEATVIPEGTAVIASGPLTSEPLSRAISQLTGSDYFYFYDAISPIVDAASIDYSQVFKASRYGEGEGDYLNCPLTEKQYEEFWAAVRAAELAPVREFEDFRVFEGCLPVEVLAGRGPKTLLFGPMKPVGLVDPRTGLQPFAAIQLRQENREASLYNIVGFQTRMTWPEQRKIFRTIPGLENAEFFRYGSMHRNTFINSPALLNEKLQLKSRPELFFAGQISGVEGYVESAAMGLLAGIFAAGTLGGKEIAPPPRTTAIGALLHHAVCSAPENFQPMNVNFGLFEPLPGRVKKKDKGQAYARRAIEAIRKWRDTTQAVLNNT